jgi:predicted DNA-binding transcriptional regulator YafY
MNRTERIALLHDLLSSHPSGLSDEHLMREAQCSRSTLYRDLTHMRDTLGAPIEHEGHPERTWRYVNQDGIRFQLAGIWTTPDEIHVLTLIRQIAQHSDNPAIREALEPLEPLVQELLGDKAKRLDRLQIERDPAPQSDPDVFRVVSQAVLGGHQLRFAYQARSSTHDSEHLVSPQRLMHHRDHWTIDAWDPEQSSLLRFAVDRIRRPQLMPEATIDLPPLKLNNSQDAGYGILAGPALAIAVIHFTGQAARWVAEEIWHPHQCRRILPDGTLELSIPYSHPRELLIDVQRHGADAEVISPPELREEMKRMWAGEMAKYGVKGEGT